MNISFNNQRSAGRNLSSNVVSTAATPEKHHRTFSNSSNSPGLRSPKPQPLATTLAQLNHRIEPQKSSLTASSAPPPPPPPPPPLLPLRPVPAAAAANTVQREIKRCLKRRQADTGRWCWAQRCAASVQEALQLLSRNDTQKQEIEMENPWEEGFSDLEIEIVSPCTLAAGGAPVAFQSSGAPLIRDRCAKVARLYALQNLLALTADLSSVPLLEPPFKTSRAVLWAETQNEVFSSSIQSLLVEISSFSTSTIINDSISVGAHVGTLSPTKSPKQQKTDSISREFSEIEFENVEKANNRASKAATRLQRAQSLLSSVPRTNFTLSPPLKPVMLPKTTTQPVIRAETQVSPLSPPPLPPPSPPLPPSLLRSQSPPRIQSPPKRRFEVKVSATGAVTLSK